LSENCIHIAIDGACKGNPGPAGIGVLMTDSDGQVVAKIARSIGITTNNVAEYEALLTGLREASKMGYRKVSVQTDSQLLARQIAGQYKVSAPHLQELHAQAHRLIAGFDKFEINHTLRAGNAKADALANLGVRSIDPNAE